MTPRGAPVRPCRRRWVAASFAALVAGAIALSPTTARADGGDVARIVIAATLTAGGAAGVAIGGTVAAGEVDTIEAHCPGRVCDPEGYDAVQRGQAAGGIATVSAFVGAASAVWLSLELVSLATDVGDDTDPDAPKPLAPTQASLRARLAPIAGGAAMRLELGF